MNKEFKTYEFVSRQQSYSVVLVNGMPGNRNTGEPPTPGVHLRFVNGYAKISRPINSVNPDELYKRAQMHPSYNKDFIDITNKKENPFGTRDFQSGPQHEIMEMDHGGVGKTMGSPIKPKFNDIQKRAIKSMFAEMLVEMPVSKFEEILTKKKETEKPHNTDNDLNVNNTKKEKAADGKDANSGKDPAINTQQKDSKDNVQN